MPPLRGRPRQAAHRRSTCSSRASPRHPHPEGGGERQLRVGLAGGSGHTIYFADRPNRDAGAVPTTEAMATIDFESADPPNAGLVAETDDGEWIIILALMNPRLDEATATLTYEVRRVTDYAGEGLQSLAAKVSAGAVPEQFGPASLFIDSATTPPYCY